MPIIAAIQLQSQDDIDANLRIIEHAIATACAQHARLIVLPENACMMGSQHALAHRYDELVTHFGHLARQHGIYLVAGTLPCPNRDDGKPVPDGKYRQTSLLYHPDGTVIGRYDKIHLFRADVADGVGNYDEGRTFEAGNTPVIIPCMLDDMVINVGLTICFDARFPRLYQSLRQMGADIIVVPSAFTHTTGQAHWTSLLTARALDSQCLIVGAAQGGTHHYIHKDKSASRQTWGHALMVDAYGRIMASTDRVDAGEFDIIYHNFDKSTQDTIRSAMPLIHCHRLA